MADAPSPTCTCRAAWTLAVIAVIIALVSVTLPRSTPAYAAKTDTPTEPPTAAQTPAVPSNESRLAETTAELLQVRRVLDDAQSALAQRDREIATATDELRVLRQELEALRAKGASKAP